MRYVVFSLLKKDFRLMLASKFFLLALGSLILYSCYINLVYVRLDQEIYPVYLYDPMGVQSTASSAAIRSESAEQMHQACSDGYSVGIDASGRVPPHLHGLLRYQAHRQQQGSLCGIPAFPRF